MSQLLPIVGPDNPETHSIFTVQKAKLKDQHLTCEFTEQRSEEVYYSPKTGQISGAC